MTGVAWGLFLTTKKIMNLKTFCILLAVLCFGCGGHPKPVGLPVLVPCEINITQNGEPLDGAVVSLLPDDGAKGWGTIGHTDASGKAVMNTRMHWKGAPKGKYIITVTRSIQETLPGKEGEGKWDNLVTYNTIQKEYGDVSQSSLRLEVTGKTSATFDVGKAVKERVRY